MADLREAGARVNKMGSRQSPFFSIEAHLLQVNGQVVQVFDFPDKEMADSAADQISPDGRIIGAHRLEIKATPHFYKDVSLIVLFIGDDELTIAALTETLGEPITQPPIFWGDVSS